MLFHLQSNCLCELRLAVIEGPETFGAEFERGSDVEGIESARAQNGCMRSRKIDGSHECQLRLTDVLP